MADVQLPDGSKFPRNSAGQAIVWLPRGVDITLDVVGPDLEMSADRRDVDVREVVSDSPRDVAVTKIDKSRQGMTFTLKGITATDTVVRFKDRAGKAVGSLIAVPGDVRKHPGMDFDLMANVIGGSDAGNRLAIQRLLLNDPDNIFEQHNTANIADFGRMGCGKVVNGRGKQVFRDMSPIFYEHPYHEPVSVVRKRSDVKYRSGVISQVRSSIKGFLARGIPVRVGVLDGPVGMHIQDGKLIAYYVGGHTVLIFACNNAATNFLYIDPWGGGSKFQYEGGIPGAVSRKCDWIGMFTAAYDAARSVGPASAEPNLLRQDSLLSEGSFNTAAGNFLEVVSGPVLIAPSGP